MLVSPVAFTQLGFGAQLRHHQIVDMHMGARGDGLRRRPDHLPVSPHRFSRGNRRDSNFVSGRNRLARGDIIGDRSACGQSESGSDHQDALGYGAAMWTPSSS